MEAPTARAARGPEPLSRRSGTLVGALLFLVGLVWFFQGIGVLPGSFMTGQPFWAAMGVLFVGIGAALFRRARTRPQI